MSFTTTIIIKNQEIERYQFITLLYLHISHENLDVILPFDEKLNEIRRKDYQIIWRCNKSDGKLEVPSFFNQQFRDSLKNNEIRFIAISLHLHSCYYSKKGGHANILLLDKKKSEIERFEPNGKIASVDEQWYNSPSLDNALHVFFKDNFKIKYIPPKKFMPDDGPQYCQTKENKINDKVDPSGYCVAWTTLYVELRVSKPTKKRSTIVKEMNNISKDLTSYIRDYSDVILNKLKE